jgi:hypothetical protein
VQALGPKDELPPLLTVKEVAAALRIDAVRLTRRGGYSVRIPVAELRRLLEPGEESSDTEDRTHGDAMFKRVPGSTWQ